MSYEASSKSPSRVQVINGLSLTANGGTQTSGEVNNSTHRDRFALVEISPGFATTAVAGQRISLSFQVKHDGSNWQDDEEYGFDFRVALAQTATQRLVKNHVRLPPQNFRIVLESFCDDNVNSGDCYFQFYSE